MNIHEFEAKLILKRYHVPIPDFDVASKIHDVEKIVQHMGLKEAVVKIQVHAGGRGKAGGVKFAKTPEEIVKVGGAAARHEDGEQPDGPGRGRGAQGDDLAADRHQKRILPGRCDRSRKS